MATIYVTDREGGEHVLEAKNGMTIMESIREIDGGVEALCGGMCSCATCHIFVDPAWASKLNDVRDDELELLEDTENYREGESRLSCQVAVSDDVDGLKLTVAPEE